MKTNLTVIASKLKGNRWVDESKLPSLVQCDYIRVYQHSKDRDAERAVRAAAVPRLANAEKNGGGQGGVPSELN